ncbi:hypothetical protein D3C78_1169070 [compost metagenome]
MQPALEHPAAHWCDGAVEHCGKGIFHATGQILRDFKITTCGRIHDDAVLLAFHRNRPDMGQGGALRIFYVLQQTACGAQTTRRVLDAKANQIPRAKLQV